MSVSQRINLYLNSGNYGEDTISNHIVGCYLFPGQCRIHHWQAIWGMYCTYCWLLLVSWAVSYLSLTSNLRYVLYILLVVTCFLGGAVAITDKEFEVCTVHIVGCYLFPGRCPICHWRAIWGLYCTYCWLLLVSWAVSYLSLTSNLRYVLYILLVATCFLGGVLSVTDKQFEVCTAQIVGCYLFPGRCPICHWQAIWGMYCTNCWLLLVSWVVSYLSLTSNLRYVLHKLLVVTCFLGGVLSVTDKQFNVSTEGNSQPTMFSITVNYSLSLVDI